MSRTIRPVIPKGESIRKAVRWISDQRRHDPKTVEVACLRFDLSPLEEEFVMSHFVQRLVNESADHDAEVRAVRVNP